MPGKKAASKKKASKKAPKAAAPLDGEADAKARAEQFKAEHPEIVDNPIREVMVSEKHLERDLLKIMVEEVKRWDTPWAKLREIEQQALIDRIRFDLHVAAMFAVAKIAAADTYGVRGRLTKITIGDKTVLNIAVGHDDLAQLAEHQGQEVVVALVDFERWSAGVEQIHSEADQRDLLASTLQSENDGSAEGAAGGSSVSSDTQPPAPDPAMPVAEPSSPPADPPPTKSDPDAAPPGVAEFEGGKYGSPDPTRTADGKEAMTKEQVEAMATPADSWIGGNDGTKDAGRVAQRIQREAPPPSSWEELPSVAPDQSMLSDGDGA